MSSDCRSPQPPAPPRDRRPSYGKRRAWVLLAVHVAILAHVLQWLSTGATLSPVEPSEATDLAEHGRLNAGAIFFLITIASTLLLGRWFCGWACHLVAVQDGCRWLLQRAGVRPRPISLGVLGLVPLVACIYMFFGPWLYRLWRGIAVEARVELYTERFWATFPGVTMSLVSFVVCGLAIVYFLGSKGFCTYACPYGAIFGVADQFAPQRIRVTDACQGCGKCTAACSSNVRVHQEVRDFAAVVDPGCMKCLDCVGACPMDALYVGFGAPALWTRARGERRERAGSPWPRLALTLVFIAGLYAVLLSHQRQFSFSEHGDFLLALSVATALIAWVFRGRSSRASSPSLAEGIVLAATYLGGLYVLRGYQPLAGVTPWIVERLPLASLLELDEGLPLLLSLGVAGLLAYAVLLAYRMLLRSEVALQAVALRTQGRTTLAGKAFVAATCVMLALTAHAAIERRTEGLRARDQSARRESAEHDFALGVAHMEVGALDSAEAAFRAALAAAPTHVAARKRLAGVLFALGRDSDCSSELELALAAAPADVDLHFLRGLVSIRAGNPEGAQAAWNAVLALDASHPAAREALAALCDERGERAAAADHRARARPAGP